MAKAENYNDLIFQLGDLARDRLAEKQTYPRSMDRVFRAEDALVARQGELQALEDALNAEDADYQEFLAAQLEERKELEATVKRFRKAVDAIEGKVKELRKKLASERGGVRYDQNALKKEEKKHADLEMSADSSRIELSKQNLKKMRLASMRRQRGVEDLEAQLASALTPAPGQAGAEGILAHARMIQMEDEAVLRKADLDEKIAQLDEAIVVKEQEIQAAEDYLDQALFLLGEECYKLRLPDPALAPFYPRLDSAE